MELAFIGLPTIPNMTAKTGNFKSKEGGILCFRCLDFRCAQFPVS